MLIEIEIEIVMGGSSSSRHISMESEDAEGLVFVKGIRVSLTEQNLRELHSSLSDKILASLVSYTNSKEKKQQPLNKQNKNSASRLFRIQCRWVCLVFNLSFH